MLPTTGWVAYPMPPSGIVLADVPSRVRVRVGTLEFEGNTPWRASFVYADVDTVCYLSTMPIATAQIHTQT